MKSLEQQDTPVQLYQQESSTGCFYRVVPKPFVCLGQSRQSTFPPHDTTAPLELHFVEATEGRTRLGWDQVGPNLDPAEIARENQDHRT